MVASAEKFLFVMEESDNNFIGFRLFTRKFVHSSERGLTVQRHYNFGEKAPI